MPGNDQYTKLLLHCDGAGGSTSFPDASTSGHVTTAVGNAQVDVSGKFNQSAILDGAGDYLSVADIAGGATGLTKNAETLTGLYEETNVVKKIDVNKAILVNERANPGGLREMRSRVVSISASTVSYGAMTPLKTSMLSQARNIDMAILSITKFIVSYYESSLGKLSVVVGTIAGTTIAAGTSAPHSVITAGIGHVTSICKLDTDKALVVSISNTGAAGVAAVVVTIVGDVPTYNTVATVESTDLYDNINVIQLDVNKALLIYNSIGTSSIIARVLTVTGTTITVNAATVDAVSPTNLKWDLTKLSATKAVMGFNGLTSNQRASVKIIDISGTVPTIQPVQTPFGAITATSSDLSTISSTQIFYAMQSGNDAKASILDISGSTATLTATDLINTPGSVAPTCDFMGGNQVVVSYENSANSTTPSLIYTLTGIVESDWKWSADYTIDFWINPDTFAGTDKIFFYNGGTGAGFFRLAYQPATSRIYISYGSSLYFFSGSALTLNVWQHLELSRSGASTKLFIDGVQKGATVTDSSIPIGADNMILFSYDGTADYYSGRSDEIRISNGIARHTANFTPPTAPYGVDALTQRMRNRKVFPVDIVTPEAIVW